MNTPQGHIFQIQTITGKEAKDQDTFLTYLKELKKIFKNSTKSIITGEDKRGEAFIPLNFNEKKEEGGTPKLNEQIELQKNLDSIYKNSISNYTVVLEEQFKDIDEEKLQDKSVLIQVPSTHAAGFLPKLINTISESDSILSKVKLEYFVVDSESVINFQDEPEKITELYGDYIEKMKAADKFIEIKDTTMPYSKIIDTTQPDLAQLSNTISKSEKKFLAGTKELADSTPRLKTYFPTQQQADDSGLSLLEFTKIMGKINTSGR